MVVAAHWWLKTGALGLDTFSVFYISWEFLDVGAHVCTFLLGNELMKQTSTTHTLTQSLHLIAGWASDNLSAFPRRCVTTVIPQNLRTVSCTCSSRAAGKQGFKLLCFLLQWEREEERGVKREEKMGRCVWVGRGKGGGRNGKWWRVNWN